MAQSTWLTEPGMGKWGRWVLALVLMVSRPGVARE